MLVEDAVVDVDVDVDAAAVPEEELVPELDDPAVVDVPTPMDSSALNRAAMSPPAGGGEAAADDSLLESVEAVWLWEASREDRVENGFERLVAEIDVTLMKVLLAYGVVETGDPSGPHLHL